MTGTTSSRRYSSEPSNRYCSCGCQSDLYNVPEENKKTSVTKCTNCSESRLVRCQGACKCRRMCYCLICLGNRKCGDESKECTSCLRRIDTDHFLNGDGCQCKRKQLEIKNQYQNKVDKLLKIIGVVLNHNSSEEVERSARRGRYTQRIDDSEEDEVVDKGIGVDSSTSANTSVARDPSSQLANSAIKSKSGKGIGVGPSTSADTSVARDPSSQLATSSKSANTSVAEDSSLQAATTVSSTSADTSVAGDSSSQAATSFTSRITDIKYWNARVDKCKSFADFRPIAKDFIEKEVPRFQNLVKDFKNCAGLVYTLQDDYKKSYDDLRYQITRLNNWEFSSTLSLTEARTK